MARTSDPPALPLAALLLGACAGPALPTGFAALAAEAPEDVPARLWLEGDACIAAATAVGPGGLPATVRVAADAIAPAGELVFAGRAWGPRGAGFRIEKRYVEGTDESFRSVLLAADGTVLERTHSVPIAQVPVAVLTSAMTAGRDVRRCEIVSGPEREEGWRALVQNGAGRTFVVALALDGRLLSTQRVVRAVLSLP
jgi:hypothetical protein